jgi:hypothetical protein
MLLDCLALGVLEPAAAAMVSGHVESCPECRARVADAAAERPHPREDAIVEGVRLRARLQSRRRVGSGLPAWWRRWAWIPTAVTAVLAVALGGMLYVARHDIRTSGAGTDTDAALGQSDAAGGGVRLKGATDALSVYVKRDGTVSRAASGDRFLQGDHVQFSWYSVEPGYVAVYGIDPVRTTCYTPGSGRSPTRVEGGREVPLQPAVALDATAGAELVMALFCPRPFDVSDMEKRLGATGGLGAAGLPTDCRAVLFQMVKDSGNGH